MNKEITILREFLMNNDVPDAVHKVIIRRINHLDLMRLELDLTAKAGKRWTEEDTKTIETLMNDWRAETRKDSDDKIQEVAYALKRPIQTVTKKLKSLGYGAAMDWWWTTRNGNI